MMNQCKKVILRLMFVLEVHFQLGLHCYFRYKTYFVMLILRKKLIFSIIFDVAQPGTPTLQTEFIKFYCYNSQYGYHLVPVTELVEFC